MKLKIVDQLILLMVVAVLGGVIIYLHVRLCAVEAQLEKERKIDHKILLIDPQRIQLPDPSDVPEFI